MEEAWAEANKAKLLVWIASDNARIDTYGTDYKAAQRAIAANPALADRPGESYFDAALYVAVNADLKASLGTDAAKAAEHYIQSGRAQGRTLRTAYEDVDGDGAADSLAIGGYKTTVTFAGRNESAIYDNITGNNVGQTRDLNSDGVVDTATLIMVSGAARWQVNLAASGLQTVTNKGTAATLDAAIAQVDTVNIATYSNSLNTLLSPLGLNKTSGVTYTATKNADGTRLVKRSDGVEATFSTTGSITRVKADFDNSGVLDTATKTGSGWSVTLSAHGILNSGTGTATDIAQARTAAKNARTVNTSAGATLLNAVLSPAGLNKTTGVTYTGTKNSDGSILLRRSDGVEAVFSDQSTIASVSAAFEPNGSVETARNIAGIWSITVPGTTLLSSATGSGNDIAVARAAAKAARTVNTAAASALLNTALTSVGFNRTTGVTYTGTKNADNSVVLWRSDGIEATFTPAGTLASVTANFDSRGLADTATKTATGWSVALVADGILNAATGTGSDINSAQLAARAARTVNTTAAAALLNPALTSVGLNRTTGVTYTATQNADASLVLQRSDGVTATISATGVLGSITADFDGSGLADTATQGTNGWRVILAADGILNSASGTGSDINLAQIAAKAARTITPTVAEALLNPALTSVGLNRTTGVTYTGTRNADRSLVLQRSDGVTATITAAGALASVTADFDGSGVADTATKTATGWSVALAATGSLNAATGTGTDINLANAAARSARTVNTTTASTLLNGALPSVGLNRTTGVTYTGTKNTDNSVVLRRSDGVEATFTAAGALSSVTADFDGSGLADTGTKTATGWSVTLAATGSSNAGTGTGSDINAAYTAAKSTRTANTTTASTLLNTALTSVGLNRTAGVTYTATKNADSSLILRRSDGVEATFTIAGTLASVTADFDGSGLADTATKTATGWSVALAADGILNTATGAGADINLARTAARAARTVNATAAAALLNPALTSVGLNRTIGVTYTATQNADRSLVLQRSDGVTANVTATGTLASLTADVDGSGLADTATKTATGWSVALAATGPLNAATGTGTDISLARTAARAARTVNATTAAALLNNALTSVGLNRTSGVTYTGTQNSDNSLVVGRSDGLTARFTAAGILSSITANFMGTGTLDTATKVAEGWSLSLSAGGVGVGATLGDAKVAATASNNLAVQYTGALNQLLAPIGKTVPSASSATIVKNTDGTSTIRWSNGVEGYFSSANVLTGFRMDLTQDGRFDTVRKNGNIWSVQLENSLGGPLTGQGSSFLSAYNSVINIWWSSHL